MRRDDQSDLPCTRTHQYRFPCPIGLDIEELTSREADQNDTDEDNIEGWHDPRQDLSDEEREVLDKSLQPVRLVLVKASYKIT